MLLRNRETTFAVGLRTTEFRPWLCYVLKDHRKNQRSSESSPSLILDIEQIETIELRGEAEASAAGTKRSHFEPKRADTIKFGFDFGIREDLDSALRPFLERAKMSMIDRERFNETTGLSDEEVSNDAVQLVTISVFNGLCRTISALAANGLLSAQHLEDIHDAITTPLDDPDLRDDDFITFTRETVEKALAVAVRDARDG